MMTLPKALIYISFVVATIFTTTPTAVTPQKTKVLLLTEKDNQKSVSLHQGKTMTLKLEENASTGYVWQFQNWNDKAFHIQSDTVETPTNGKDAVVGASGTRVWSIKALKKGTYTLMAKLYPSWQKADTAEKTFQITVKVL